MATVGDYVAFGDGVVALTIGGDIDHTYTFAIPSNVNRNQAAILSWRLETVGDPHNLAWNWSLNQTTVANFRHDVGFLSVLQEVMGGVNLRVGDNTLIATVTGGRGQVKLSDIVVHFQVNV